MALSILFMLLFSFILVIRNYKNKYSLLIILMLLGMSIAMFTILSEIYRSSNYIIASRHLYSGIEYKMYLSLNRILVMPISNLLVLRNLGIITYLFAIMLFTLSFNNTIKSGHKSSHRIVTVIRNVILFAYPVLYYCFYHPSTAYLIYLKKYSYDNMQNRILWINFITAADSIMTCLALIYLLYPICFLIRNYLLSKITFFAKQLLGLSLSMGLLNIIFFRVFFIGAFRASVNNVFRFAFWRYKSIIIVPDFYASLLPIMSLVILIVIIFIVSQLNTVNIIAGLRGRAIKKNLNLLNTNLKDVLHSNKNIMFNMKILSEEAINSYGTPEGLEKLNKILLLSENNIHAISKVLNNIRELKVSTLKNNFTDCIEAALSEVSIPDKIKLIKHYSDTNLLCDFDMYHMTQAISNLLANAVDAINSSESSASTIDITVDASKEWIYCAIRDSGCGIPRKILKKIFNPYFSTKSKQNNWGIGLSYVFRVITSHYGHMRIMSRPGEYTQVEILLPRKS